jgi:hypothetical protein
MNSYASPREEWLFDKSTRRASASKADEFGAIFFYLVKFCDQLPKSNIFFQLFNMDTQNIGLYLAEMKFDPVKARTASTSSHVHVIICVDIKHM